MGDQAGRQAGQAEGCDEAAGLERPGGREYRQGCRSLARRRGPSQGAKEWLSVLIWQG